MSPRSCMKDTWCWKFVNTRPGKIFKFTILLILDLIDVVIDWYFYAKVQFIKPGLIYGPPTESYKWAIFAFCIVSTLTLLIETIQNADDLLVKKKFPFLSQSLTNLLTVVFEDVPLLSLNLMLALCRDGDVSVISLTKASLCIACVIVRFTLMVLVYWIFEKKKSRFEFVCDIISTIGLIAVALLSIMIQLLNNFPIDNRGLIKIVDPNGFDRYSFQANKYFPDVGVYMTWPPTEDTDRTAYTNYQLWLTDINEIRFNEEVQLELTTSVDTRLKASDFNNYTLCISKSTRQSKLKNCYTIFNQTHVFELDPTQRLDLNYGYNLKFINHKPQDYRYLMGYIDYNIKASNNQKCFNFESAKVNNTNSLQEDRLLVYAKYLFNTHKNNNDSISASYFKYYKGASASSDHYSLFNLYYDLNLAKQVWKTGIIGCHSSGDKSPQFNSNIQVSC